MSEVNAHNKFSDAQNCLSQLGKASDNLVNCNYGIIGCWQIRFYGSVDRMGSTSDIKKLMFSRHFPFDA